MPSRTDPKYIARSLVVKFKIPKSSHQKGILYAWILNLIEIKNKLYSLLVNYETDLMSLIRLWLETKLLQQLLQYICANDGLFSLIIHLVVYRRVL